MTNTKFAACGVFATLALAACSTAPPRDGTTYDKISSELKDAAANRAAREQQQSVLQSLLPPLSDRKSTRLNSSHIQKSRMPSSA